MRVAFEPARFDESRGVITGRIAEHRACVRQAQGLGRDSTLQQLADSFAGARAVTGRKTKACFHEPLVDPERAVAKRDVAITHLELLGFAVTERTSTVDGPDGSHVI